MSNMFVGMMFSGVVLAKWSLSSGDITTTIVFRSGCHPERLCLAIEQPFLRLPQRSSSLVLSRRRHSRARLLVLSNQTRFQREELSNGYWQTPTDTKEVLQMHLQRDCPQGPRLVSGRHLDEFAWSIDCLPPHPVESLPDRAPGAV